MFEAVNKYFSEFKILKTSSKDFWLVQGIQFFDGLAYFAMITVLALFLTSNCGFSDVESGFWVGVYTLFITAFVFAVGAICDVIGIKKSFLIGISLLLVSRAMMFWAPSIFDPGADLTLMVQGSLILLAMGSAFSGPVLQTALRRFTTKKTRATGFNIYYLIMNIGAIVASLVIIEGFRNGFTIFDTKIWGWGETEGNLMIFNFGFYSNLVALCCVLFLNENNYADPEERYAGHDHPRPLAIFMQVWKEKPFQKLLIFLLLTLGVRLVFTHQFIVMPKYYVRTLYNDFELGMINAINPVIIVVGLIAIIPIVHKYSTVSLMLWGMAISAFSLIFMALPIEWYLALPWINTLSQAFVFVIITQILVFAFGELLFSPRFSEYVANVAPKDKVASYMALSALPMFIAKPINAVISGVLISYFCYDGIRAKMDTGHVAYDETPQFMWLLYLSVAILSPLCIWYFKDSLTKKNLPPPEPENDAEAKKKLEDAALAGVEYLDPTEQESELSCHLEPPTDSPEPLPQA